jgi:hypothetical protein
MAKRKNESVLGLPALPAALDAGRNGALAPIRPRGALTHDEQRVVEERRKQEVVMQGFQIKANTATNLIAEVEQHGVTKFDEVAGYIVELKEQQRSSKEHQAYTEEFCKRAIHTLAKHELGIMEVAATNIGIEVNRGLYPPPEKPEPRGFLERLLG